MNMPACLKNWGYSLLLSTCILSFSTQRVLSQDWQRTAGPPGGAARSLALLPNQTLLAGSSKGLFVSGDHGASWSPRGEGVITEAVQALLALDNGNAFAGTANGLYQSIDEGRNWIALPFPIDEPGIVTLTAGQPGELFAGSSTNGVFRSTDAGVTWTPINAGLTDARIRTLAYSKAGDLYAGTDIGLFRLPDQSSTWQIANDGLSQAADRRINTMLSLPSGMQFLGTASGLFESDADLRVWEPLVRDLGAPDHADGVVSIVQHPTGTLYAATSKGVFRSTDEGILWEAVTTGLPAAFSPNTAVHTLLLNGRAELLAGTDRFGVSKFIASQAIWEASNVGFSAQTVTSMALTNRGVLLAGTDIGLFKATANGQQWEHAIVDETLTGFNLLDSYDFKLIFATDSTLIISRDGAETWEPIFEQKPVAFLALDEFTYIASVQHGDIWWTEDGGEIWDRVGDIPSEAALFNVYDFVQALDGTLYAGTTAGVFVSTDKGMNWSPVSLDPPLAHAFTMDVDAASGRIYAGGSKGLYRSDPSQTTWEYVLAIESDVVEIFSPLLAITTGDGLFRPRTDGASWEAVNMGLPEGKLVTGLLDGINIAGALNTYISYAHAGVFLNEGFISLSTGGTPGINHSQRLTVYPNPSQEMVTLQFTLDTPGHVDVAVFDVLGTLHASLLSTFLPGGDHEITWTPEDTAPGVYMIRLTTEKAVTSTAVVVLH